MRVVAVRGALIASCCAVVAAGLVIGTTQGRGAPAPTAVEMRVAEAGPTTLRSTLRSGGREPVAAVVADATGPSIELYSEPGVPNADRPTIDNPTAEGLPVVFEVEEERGPWLRVRVSMRPNGSEAWVRRAQVHTRTVPHRIEVRLSERRLLLHRGDRIIMEETVAIGSDRTPTPTGHFFVDGWVPLDGTGPYGSGQLSVAGFSEVLHSFGGGVGQIAIHGTNRPNRLGQAISNGCIRMSNEAIERLVKLAPLGTPVDVVS